MTLFNRCPHGRIFFDTCKQCKEEAVARDQWVKAYAHGLQGIGAKTVMDTLPYKGPSRELMDTLCVLIDAGMFASFPGRFAQESPKPDIMDITRQIARGS
jgi:hypothetical protein